jgi:hypothetical protein
VIELPMVVDMDCAQSIAIMLESAFIC